MFDRLEEGASAVEERFELVDQARYVRGRLSCFELGGDGMHGDGAHGGAASADLVGELSHFGHIIAVRGGVQALETVGHDVHEGLGHLIGRIGLVGHAELVQRLEHRGVDERGRMVHAALG